MITVNRTTRYLLLLAEGSSWPRLQHAAAVQPLRPETMARPERLCGSRQLIARVVREHHREVPDRGRQWRIRPVTAQNVTNDEPEYQVVLNKAPVPRLP